MAEPVRLRVVFEDAALLTESQRRRGLQRCWLQLRPDLATVADLAAEILQTFGLHNSCPHGLIISMDDFVLPPFESTCILKDEDIIMINKSGVMFNDFVKFYGSQNQELVLQSRETSAFKNKSLIKIDPHVNPGGDSDMVPCNEGAVQMETLSIEKMHAQRKRKLSIQGSDYTLAFKDSHGDSLEYEEDKELHGNMAHQETASNEMVKKKRKKKHTDKFQTSITLENKNFQVDSQQDKAHLILPFPHKEVSSSKIIQIKRKKKHSDKLQGSNDTSAIEDYDGNSQRNEQDVGYHVNAVHSEATSHEMMNSKHKRKDYNTHQASVSTLTSKSFKVNSQEGKDLGIFNGSESHREIPSCEMTNAKKKKKRSNRHQGSDDLLAIKDSSGDSPRCEGAGAHVDIVHNETSINELMDGKRKKKRSKKHYTSDNTSVIVNCQGDVPGDDEVVDLPSGIIASTVVTREVSNVIKRRHVHKLMTPEIEFNGNGERHAAKADANKDAKKVPSRSAKRKKAKRIWHRMHGSNENLIEIQPPESGNQEELLEHANAGQNTEMDKEIVPITVRPGHIRFENSDECSVREDELGETLQWNGINSKKKGQKWGREKRYKKRNADTYNLLCNGESEDKETEVVEVLTEKFTIEEVETNENIISEQVEPVTECENSISKELKADKQLIDYERFLPLRRIPEEGDILIYRVVELSSSWCPELSPFRVGRVSSYDSLSSKVILLPLPEYPLMSEEFSEGQENESLYKEDGTLEIDFSFLLDVRLFKALDPEETTLITPIEETQNSTLLNNQESEGFSNHAVTAQQLSEGWEAINRAIDEKKAQLQKRSNFDKRKPSASTGSGPWSYKALRRNALGPTLAMLRNTDSVFIQGE